MESQIFVDHITATKQTYRDTVWDYLENTNIAEFPRPVKNRIPNFKGANAACDNCATLNEYKSANLIKVNPDKPQQRIRYLALQTGKTLLVPTPRLEKGLFNKIILPDNSKDMLEKCSSSEVCLDRDTITGVRHFSHPIGLNDKVKIDCIVLGSVAVSPKGFRIGKGEGYADMEYGMMKTMGAIDDRTPVITTVHDCQVFDDLPGRLFDQDHDVPVDYICTPTKIIKCDKTLNKPTGIVWSLLSEEQLEKMPILRKLKEMS